MPEWMIYLLKVNTAVMLFYLGYYFSLRKLTFFNLNRYYLLLGTLFSLLYPLVDIAALFERHRYLPQRNLLPLRFEDIAPITEPQIAFWDTLIIVFSTVVALLLMRFFVRLMRLWDIHRQSERAVHQFYSYRKVLLHINPFSFWKCIYMNPSLHMEKDLKQIFKHESIHVNELHTVDILLIEIVCAACWFNPTVWFMRTAIKENLEFLTDSKVLDSGVDRKTYQYSLVNMITQDQSPLIANHFNLKAFKRRIQMMNKKNSSRLNLGKYFFLVPTITLSVMVFGVSRAYQHPPTDERKLDNAATTVPGDIVGKVLGLELGKSSRSGMQDSSEMKKDKVLIKVRPSSGAEPLYILDGIPIDNLNQLNSNNIKSIEVLKKASATALYGSRGKNGVVIVTSKEKRNIDSNADQSTTVGTASKNDLDTIANPAILHKNVYKAVAGEEGKTFVKKLPAGVMYIIDGKIAKEADVEKLGKDDIESVDVIKGNQDKGTIRITTKKR